MLKELLNYFRGKEREWEELCLRCGGCCGAFDDPCRQLTKDAQGKYYCLIYENRLGPQTTVKGERFDCVPIRDIFRTRWRGDYLCTYKKFFKIPWLKADRAQSQFLPSNKGSN